MTSDSAADADKKVVKVESQYVIALDEAGRLVVKAWLVGHEFKETRWLRTHVDALAAGAGLARDAISGGRLSRLDEFRRACKSLERDIHEARTLVVRLSDGRDFEFNASVRVEVRPVDGERTGSEYQVNRKVKWFVEEIERALPPGVTKEMVMAAISARGDTNHEITQNIGKLVLVEPEDDEKDGADVAPRVEVRVYEQFRDDPTYADRFLLGLERRVQERFEEARSVYTHEDIRNAWNRQKKSMVGSFSFNFGNGGMTFVISTYHNQLVKWRAFMRSLYNAPVFDMLPILSTRETSEVVSARAQEAVEREWENLTRSWVERIEKAQAKYASKPEKLDREVEKLHQSMSAGIEDLQENIDAINDVIEPMLRIVRQPKPEVVDRLKAKVTDPRLRSMFVQRGVWDDDVPSAPTQSQGEPDGARPTPRRSKKPAGKARASVE